MPHIDMDNTEFKVPHPVDLLRRLQYDKLYEGAWHAWFHMIILLRQFCLGCGSKS